MPEERHFVYGIELDKDVLYESQFKKATDMGGLALELS